MHFTATILSVAMLAAGLSAQQRRDLTKPEDLRLFVRGGYGSASVDIGSGTNIDGSTGAFLIGAEFEAFKDTIGGGAQLEYNESDSDLFSDNLPGVSTGTKRIEFFPHLSTRTTSDDASLIFRVGPVIQEHELGIGPANIDTLGFGVQLELEPEVFFNRSDPVSFSLYGRLRGGVLAASIDSNAIGGSFTTTGANLGVELGVRARTTGSLMISAGLIHRGSYYDQSDPKSGFVVEETDFAFTGGFIGIGGSW